MRTRLGRWLDEDERQGDSRLMEVMASQLAADRNRSRREGRKKRQGIRIVGSLVTLAAWKPCKQVAWEMECKNTNSIQKDNPEYSAKKRQG